MKMSIGEKEEKIDLEDLDLNLEDEDQDKDQKEKIKRMIGEEDRSSRLKYTLIAAFLGIISLILVRLVFTEVFKAIGKGFLVMFNIATYPLPAILVPTLVGLIIFVVAIQYLSRRARSTKLVFYSAPSDPEWVTEDRDGIIEYLDLDLGFLSNKETKPKIIEKQTTKTIMFYTNKSLLRSSWSGKVFQVSKSDIIKGKSTYYIFADKPETPKRVSKTAENKTKRIYKCRSANVGNKLYIQTKVLLKQSIKIIEALQKHSETGFDWFEEFVSRPKENIDELREEGREQTLETIKDYDNQVAKNLGKTLKEYMKELEDKEEADNIV